jgi:hypothetical protein
MIRKFVINNREPFADGHHFGAHLQYETIRGRVYGEVSPKGLLHRGIVNLDNAPTNERNAVEYWCDVHLLKPVDLAAGNGRLLYEPPNRGNKRALMFLNDAPPCNTPRTLLDAGNGFLMRRGYTWVTSGWQGDLLPGDGRMLMGVPVATNGDLPIICPIRTEICVTREGVYSFPLSGNVSVRSYPAASLDKETAELTVRMKSYGGRQPVGPEQWEFAGCEETSDGRKLRASVEHLYLASGFIPGAIYEFTYLARDPLVLGLGFAGVRDLISFLRYDDRDAFGHENPLGSGSNRKLEKAYAWGRSQSGRFLRDYIYQGFNCDEAGRRVFEAISPHAAGGGRVFLNYEFARPVTSSQQHTSQLEPELFPFAYNAVRDPQSGRRDSILKRPSTDPLVMHTQTSTEYWQKRGALVHTDGCGNDTNLPETVRLYLISSAQHNTVYGTHARKQKTQHTTNPMTIGPILRALIIAMDDWATRGTLPPPSRIPTVSGGTLVEPTRETAGFPEIRDMQFTGLHNRQLFLDYGPRLDEGHISSRPLPPRNDQGYAILVPKTDADGNDIAGIRAAWIRVPLGTYTGWNLQTRELSEGELAGLLGSYMPFAKTKTDRIKASDPRASIAERYKDVTDYLDRMRTELMRMVDERFILTEDVEPVLEDARQAFQKVSGTISHSGNGA